MDRLPLEGYIRILKRVLNYIAMESGGAIVPHSPGFAAHGGSVLSYLRYYNRQNVGQICMFYLWCYRMFKFCKFAIVS